MFQLELDTADKNRNQNYRHACLVEGLRNCRGSSGIGWNYSARRGCGWQCRGPQSRTGMATGVLANITDTASRGGGGLGNRRDRRDWRDRYCGPCVATAMSLSGNRRNRCSAKCARTA